MSEAQLIVDAFDIATARGERCALATVVSVEGSSYRRPGARMLITETGMSTGTISAGCLESDVVEHAKRVLRTGTAKLVEYNTAAATDEMVWGLGLGCNGIVRVLIEPLTAGSLHIERLRRSREEQVVMTHDYATETFVETLLPPVPLVIFGAGPDVLPILKLACEVGWRTEIVDPQMREASRARFAMANRVTLARARDAAAFVTITERTMALLMSHNYEHDLALLRFLLASPACYIGVMGARARTERMLAQLSTNDADLARLHSPVGLDIGANGPAEIALSIVAEMRAVLDGRRGGMLRERRGSIHDAADERIRIAVRPQQLVAS
jgi:xanthine dehydrogenase accessory factor